MLSQHRKVDKEGIKGISIEVAVGRRCNAPINDISHCHVMEIFGVSQPVKDAKNAHESFRDGDPMKKSSPQVEVVYH